MCTTEKRNNRRHTVNGIAASTRRGYPIDLLPWHRFKIILSTGAARQTSFQFIKISVLGQSVVHTTTEKYNKKKPTVPDARARAEGVRLAGQSYTDLR